MTYVCHDINENEVLVDNKEAAEVLYKTVIRYNKACNYICRTVELSYITPKGIKKGDLIKVVTYWPSGGKYDTTTEYLGIYDGIEIERFDLVDDTPRFQIKMNNKWTPGLQTTAKEYPYPWIPDIHAKSSCEFMPIKDNVHCYNEVFLVTEEEKNKYKEALLEHAKHQ